MKTVRNIALAAAAAGALVLGSAALAQEEKKPEPATKPQAKDQHRGEHGMSRMREMRDGCHGESQGKPAGEHRHS
jgi:uncharacterized low-complexity protein